MSCGAVTASPHLSCSSSFTNQIKKREFHLTELIDEVIYIEGQKERAVRRHSALQSYVNQLDVAFKSLLQYHLLLSQEIILPCQLESAITLAGRLGVACVTDTATRQVLSDLVSSPHLSAGARSLAQSFLNLPQGSQAVCHRTTTLRLLEEAVLISTLLIRHQQGLLDGLALVKEKVDMMIPSEVSPSSSRELVPAVAHNSYSTLQEQLQQMREERDALREQLRNREASSDREVEWLLSEKKQLESNLLDAQRCILEKEARNRSLQEQIHVIEKWSEAAASTGGVQRALEERIAHLEHENHTLRMAVAQKTPSELAAASPSITAEAVQQQVSYLKRVIASLTTDLHVMESRLAVIQDQREEERQRIIAQNERVSLRLRLERKECEVLIGKLTTELEILTASSETTRRKTSVR